MDAFHKKVVDWIRSAQKYTKFWVAVLGGALTVVAGQVALDPEVSRIVQIGLALLTAFSVYQFPNAPEDGDV